MFRRRHFHLALTVFWQPCFYGPLVRLNKTRRASVHHVSNQRKSVRSTEIMLRTGHSWNSNSRFVVVFGVFFWKKTCFMCHWQKQENIFHESSKTNKQTNPKINSKKKKKKKGQLKKVGYVYKCVHADMVLFSLVVMLLISERKTIWITTKKSYQQPIKYLLQYE